VATTATTRNRSHTAFSLFGIALFAAMQRLKKMNADDRAEGNKKPGA
jgi:hypothetical protein